MFFFLPILGFKSLVEQIKLRNQSQTSNSSPPRKPFSNNMKRGVTQSVPCLFPSSRLRITSLKLTKPHLVSRCLSGKNDRTWVRLRTKSYLLFQSWGEGGNNGQYWFVRGTLAQAGHCHYCHYCHCEPLQSHCADACHGRLVMAALVVVGPWYRWSRWLTMCFWLSWWSIWLTMCFWWS